MDDRTLKDSFMKAFITVLIFLNVEKDALFRSYSNNL